jgi:hypothetical protein
MLLKLFWSKKSTQEIFRALGTASIRRAVSYTAGPAIMILRVRPSSAQLLGRWLENGLRVEMFRSRKFINKSTRICGDIWESYLPLWGRSWLTTYWQRSLSALNPALPKSCSTEEGKLLGEVANADKTDTKSDPEAAAGDAQSGGPSLMQRR